MEFLSLGLGIFSFIMIFAYYRLAKKAKAINTGLAILYKDYVTMQEAITTNQLTTFTSADQEMHKDGFIKFLSDSRDWAFEYIESVQTGLKKFINEVEPQIDHYNKYGIVVEGMVEPHDFALKKISKEFYELKKLLPEEIDDRR